MRRTTTPSPAAHPGEGAVPQSGAKTTASPPPDGAVVTLDLPWPPSVNHYWRHVGSRVLISAPGRDYRRAVVHHCVIGRVKAARCNARLGVSVLAYPPDRRRRDIDNIAKALLDAIVHAGVIDDDGVIDRLLVERGEPRGPGGMVRVTIEELSHGGAQM